MSERSCYALPSRFARAYALAAAEHQIAFGPETVLKSTEGFGLRGRELLGERESVEKFIADAGLEDTGFATSEDRLFFLFSPKLEDDDVIITHQDEEDTSSGSESGILAWPLALDEIRAALVRFAGQSGRKLRVHFRKKEVCNLFVDSDEDALHIIIGASPPGATKSIRRAHACGVRLHPKGYTVTTNGPTEDRGVILMDEHDAKVGQLVGRNVFLFMPPPEPETIPLFWSEGGNLLLKLLQLVSRAVAQDEGEEPVEPVKSLEEYQNFLKKRLETEEEVVDEMVAMSDREIDQARTAYHEALHRKRQYLAINEGIKHMKADEALMTRMEGDWGRLSVHPLLDEITIRQNVLHLKTKRIVAEYECKRFDFGEFVIRLGFQGVVSVWSVAPTHPKGIPHPHISEQSIVCFGNAGMELERATIEFRFADAAELVLEWLSAGYDATLAQIKIEEWPEAKEETDVTESCPPAEPLRPEERPQGNRLRSWVRGKLGRGVHRPHGGERHRSLGR